MIWNGKPVNIPQPSSRGGTMMSDYKTNADNDRADDVQLLDRLVGRLVDGEAHADDHAHFRELAEDDPGLWRTLAEAQASHRSLMRGFEQTVATAVRVELPSPRRSSQSLWWIAAGAGWAAALALGLGWIAARATAPTPPALEGVPVENVPAVLAEPSPEELMSSYLDTPNVLGEWQPLFLETEEMSDGRIVLRYLRRIEEIAIFDENDELPLEGLELTEDPGTLGGPAPFGTPLD